VWTRINEGLSHFGGTSYQQTVNGISIDEAFEVLGLDELGPKLVACGF
jgi:hypothetical protein